MSDLNAPEGMELTLRTLAMPADTNAAGDIFGGWVMSQMDLAAAIRANERCNGRTVTIAANEIVFRAPVKVGDGAVTGAGSVIAKDVAKDALAITRSPQQERAGWALQYRLRKQAEKNEKKKAG